MKDRRQSSRYQTSIPCSVQLRGDSLDGKISNVSSGGALITDIENVPSVGSTVRITFTVEEKVLPVQLTAKVVHTKTADQPGSCGVQFEEPVEDVIIKLGPFLKA